jgi:hypothetical protein
VMVCSGIQEDSVAQWTVEVQCLIFEECVVGDSIVDTSSEGMR